MSDPARPTETPDRRHAQRLSAGVSQGVPPTKDLRDRVLSAVGAYARNWAPTPPLGMDELRRRTRALLDEEGLDASYEEFAAVLLNNETWREALAAVPFDRRLLLLPQCLRDTDACQGTIDEYGLLCAACGACMIQDVQRHAEQLGYVVMVAEGSAVVTALIASGKIEAVVGVSCLDMLERVFPYIEAAAVPAAAIPLLRDGCRETMLDMDWLWDLLSLSDAGGAPRLDLDSVRRQVDEWFAPEAIDDLIEARASHAQRVAAEWLALAGPRWRPFLAAAPARALGIAPDDEDLRRIALAVECFHKASLIHDDIEDGDETRYGQDTVHRRYGVPVALNAGDLLLGEGYRLLAACDASPERVARLLAVAADGHRTLCLGQGDELAWSTDRRSLGVGEVIEIFARKTAPAFEVALRLGAVLAGHDDDLAEPLARYSRAVGIAYQIRDDLEDARDDAEADDLRADRPSLLLAVAAECAEGDDAEALRRVWRGGGDLSPDRLRTLLDRLGAARIVEGMLDFHKASAIRSLATLTNPALKGLLRRVIAKIFRDVDPMVCCDEHPT